MAENPITVVVKIGPNPTFFIGARSSCQRTARMTEVKMVTRIDIVNHPHWMFRIVEKNKAQSNFHPDIR
jgi:hypothetical protein